MAYKIEVRENTQYKENESTHYLEVVEGKFEGMHFTFGKIEFVGEDDQGNGQIQFDYDLLNLPDPYKLEESRDEIEHIVGEVLRTILERNAEREEQEEAADENGNSDTEQPSEG